MTKKSGKWTPAQIGMMFEMRAQTPPAQWTTIGETLGRSFELCQHKFYKERHVRRQRGEEVVAIKKEGPPAPRRSPSTTAWSEDEKALAADLWRALITDIYEDEEAPVAVRRTAMIQISAEIGRSYASVIARRINFGTTFGAGLLGPRRIPEKSMAERDRRTLARSQRDLTAQFFGDPPPGYSALDQRRNSGA
jgi:hypothetical protein